MKIEYVCVAQSSGLSACRVARPREHVALPSGGRGVACETVTWSTLWSLVLVRRPARVPVDSATLLTATSAHRSQLAGSYCTTLNCTHPRLTDTVDHSQYSVHTARA